MFSYIKGELTSVGPDSVTVENNGIGFRVYIPSSMISMLPHIGSSVKIFTSFIVKEDSMQLYGFLSGEDLELFERMIAVSGIGPKGALSVLSSLPADKIRFAIIAGDAKTIAKAPGIGIKTAQRLIIELKDKLQIGPSELPGSGLEINQENGDPKSEAVSALVSLGYTQGEAVKAVGQVDGNADTVEEILKQSLKQLV